MRVKRILLDATCLGRRKTGNETYVRAFLGAWAAHPPPDLQMTAVVHEENPGALDPAIRWIQIPNRGFLHRQFVALPALLNREKPDLYQATYWTRFWKPYAQTLLLIHDLSFVSFPQGFRPGEAWFYRTVIRACARAARHLLTVSDFSARELKERWDIPPEKITAIPEAVEPRFHPPGPDWNPPRERYVLYVGNLHPRKNVARLIEACHQARQAGATDWKLRIVGQRAWMTGDVAAAVRRFQAEPWLEFTGYISPEDLVKQYQGALVTCYPSLYEGFGFPVLEAMACGSPVITSCATSLPEVAGAAALLVNPEDSREISRALAKVIRDTRLRRDLRRRGFAQAARFSWERNRQETESLYRRLLGANR
jgi:glycosyltransferase involved in cell wall biosynthesis